MTHEKLGGRMRCGVRRARWVQRRRGCGRAFAAVARGVCFSIHRAKAAAGRRLVEGLAPCGFMARRGFETSRSAVTRRDFDAGVEIHASAALITAPELIWELTVAASIPTAVRAVLPKDASVPMAAMSPLGSPAPLFELIGKAP